MQDLGRAHVSDKQMHDVMDLACAEKGLRGTCQTHCPNVWKPDLRPCVLPPQYMEKLDSICYLVNAVSQTEVVRAQLKAPAKSQNGMPSRPVVGTAVRRDAKH